MIRYFVGPLVALVLIVAVLFGCWWLIPLALALLALVALGYYSWRWASRVSPAGIRAWFATHRSRLAWAASIFSTILLLAILIICLWHRYAPDCTGGCLGGSTPPVVTPVTTAHAVTVPQLQTIEVGADWSEPIQVPLGGRIGFASERNLVQYEARNQDGHVVAFPAPNDEHRAFPGQLSAIQFRSLEGTPLRIRVRITPTP